MKTKKKSTAGRLFYTFGTILLLSVVAVCAINFARDGRVFQAPVLSAASSAPSAKTTAGAINNADEYKTIKYNKPKTKSYSRSSSKPKPAAKATPSPTPSPTPAPTPAAEP